MRKSLMRAGVALSLALPVAVNAVFAADTSRTGEKLQVLFQDERTYYYAENPGTGPRGKPRPAADRMIDVSHEAQMRRFEANKAFMDRLLEIPRERLNDEEKLNYDVFAFMLDRRLKEAKHRTWRMPLFSDSGFHTYPARMWRSVNFRTVEDYETYIKRLRDLPRYLEDNMVHLRTGMKDGWTMPKVVLDGLLPSFTALVSESAEDSPLYTPFVSMSAALSEEEKAHLQQIAKTVLEEEVIPAYDALDTFMKQEYYPAARDAIGISTVEGGLAYYEDMVRYYTTVDVTPDEVHQIGLREVARIRAEMEKIIEEVGFEGDFAAFLTFLRTDPQFYAKTDKELLMHASYIAKKIDGRLPAIFGKLPRQPYGIEAVPATLAPNYTTGRYSGSPLDAPRGGYYWVNTYALDKRPLYTLPALTLHEAAPGHHLQSALSKELEDVPEFRLGLYPHAYGEGWGLYSERLGIELGVYETPYEHFGRLTYEMWRACRLVIDTGIHSQGWSRQQALDLLANNSALSMHNVRTEVDRYISWPGQALAYKMGELKIMELREKATEELAEAFDLREFHDIVLSAGGIPLYLLEDRVNQWIDSQRGDDE